MHKILMARPMPRQVAQRALQDFEAVIADHVLSPDEAIAALNASGATGLVLGSNLKLDAAAVARLPAGLRVVATTSVGFDHLDVEALRARGIVVTYCPTVVTDCTADLAFMLLLCAARRAHEYSTLVRAGWGRKLGFDELLGVRVSGKTLGIVGMGRVGRAVAQRARGFDMQVIYHDRQRLAAEAELGAVFHETLDAMLPHCDFLSLHAPSDGSPLMNARTLALLPDGAVLVNAGRGTLVDEDALVASLTNGKLAAAGLDTYLNEPHIDRRLTRLDNVFLTPHMGTATRETRAALGLRALDNVAAVLDGQPALDPL